MARILVPPKDSLPHDHMRTHGWFLSRSYMERARSSTAPRHSSRSPGTASAISAPPRTMTSQIPWDSILASSTTYRPSSSHSS